MGVSANIRGKFAGGNPESKFRSRNISASGSGLQRDLDSVGQDIAGTCSRGISKVGRFLRTATVTVRRDLTPIC